MALVDDLVTAILLATAVFFVVLAFGLLVRYRQVSQRITSSSDLGRDLWQALEQRMKKQDERILDVMGRLEVVQSRVLASAAAQASASPSSTPAPAPQPQPPQEIVTNVTPPTPLAQQPESQPESQASHTLGREVQLDETQLKVIGLLAEGPKNTRQLTDAIGLSREHTARLMKELFDGGIVTRSDATKPFVYQLTDQGRRHLPSSPN
ncbi:MAG TPA: winged helix-turn-helix domain-containing protein [Nitrososphaerales archaeon]|nr:winged helix-turn-helix domain-containing protein [Nitrososphaerales archaeon]